MKNWMKRALRTFLQTAIGSVCSAIVLVNWSTDSKELRAVIIGIITTAIAAGISAVMNLYDDNKKDW